MAVTKVQVLNEDGVTYTSADIGALATNVILSDEETNVETALGNKVDKVQGKNLSTNDYTTAEKEKLAAIEAQAQKNVQSNWSQSDNSADDFIKNKPNILNTNEAFGQGYGTCSTAEDSTAKVGVLANYELVKGGIVVIRFVNKVRANSTLNINSKGAKSIYFRNNPIAANVIEAGDNVTLMYDGTYYRVISIDRGGSSGAGHTIIDNDDIVMAQRDLLQFADAKVEDDSTNNKTVIRQTQVVATKAEWDAMIPDPNVTYYLPWMSNTEYAEDRTPIGTVISVTTAKTGEVTGITTPTGEFPSSDYLVCDGAVKNIADYPKLADWFSERYGSKNYFGGNGTTTFAVPNFSADFPTNGILSIKAQMASTQITYAEVNDSLTTANNVWSAEKINSEISTIEGAWGSREELMRNTYGILYGIVHPGLKIAVLNWVGNGTTPANNTFQADLSAKYKPVTEFGVPMRNANNLLIQTDSKVTVKLTTLEWSAGTLMYPTV